jgi:class 3 adenylate cyclase
MTLVMHREPVQETQDGSVRQLDAAWGTCRDRIETEQLAYREHLAAAEADYQAAVDGAWATYQEDVARQSDERRGTKVARARSAFNDASAVARRARDRTKAEALDRYVDALDGACEEYEGAVDHAIKAAVGLVPA